MTLHFFVLMVQPLIVVIETFDELAFSFLGILFVSPRGDKGMCLFVKEVVVRTSVECGEQQGTRLFCLDKREQGVGYCQHFVVCGFVTKDSVCRKKYCQEFTSEYVAIHTQVAVFFDGFGCQRAISFSEVSGVETLEGSMKTFGIFIIVQMGVDMLAVFIEGDKFVLP